MTAESSNDTLRVDRPCRDGGCAIAEMTHYGRPTGFLWCSEHGEVVGVVERARGL